MRYKYSMYAAFTAVLFVGCADNGTNPAPATSYILNIEINPVGGGTVSRNPDKTVYGAGETVSVTATAKAGYEFVSWSGAANGTNRTITVTMSRDMTLTANFQQQMVTPPSGSLVLGHNEAWTTTDEDGEWWGLIFKSNKELVWLFYLQDDGWYGYVDGTWATNGSNITITIDDESMTGTYNVSGNYATIIIDGEASTFTKTNGIIYTDIDDLITNTFTDSRDGKTYRKVTIGNQTWMAENLNYNASGSKCYDNNNSNCNTCGRLYDWSTAMGGIGVLGSWASPSGVQGVCPSGWHLPSDAEWDALMIAVGGVKNVMYDEIVGLVLWETAGKKLKSTSGWSQNSNGTDNYGFSALPCGRGNSEGRFFNTGSFGNWWSASDFSTSSNAWGRYMSEANDYVTRSFSEKDFLSSVRCVRD